MARQRIAAAHREIVGLLEAANSSDPSAGHVVDTEAGFGRQLQAADVAVMDISAVAVGSERHAALVEHYVGDTTPGASMQRFLDACDTVVRERDRALADRG